MKVVDSNQSSKTIKFAASSGWSFRCCRHCSLSWTESFLVAELRTPSESSSGWNPSRVKTLTVFVTTFENGTMLLESSCLTGGCVYNFLSWDSKFDSRSAELFAENVPCLLICLWAESQSRNCSFCLTREDNLQILHLLSIAQPLLMQNCIEKFCPLGPLQGVSWKLRQLELW